MNAGNNFVDHPLLNGNRVSYWFDLLFCRLTSLFLTVVCVGHNTTVVVYALNPLLNYRFFIQIWISRVSAYQSRRFRHLLTIGLGDEMHLSGSESIHQLHWSAYCVRLLSNLIEGSQDEDPSRWSGRNNYDSVSEGGLISRNGGNSTSWKDTSPR